MLCSSLLLFVCVCCVVCCAWFSVRWLRFVDRCLVCGVNCSVSAVIVRCVLFVVCRSVVVVCCVCCQLLCGACCVLCVVCSVACVVCCLLWVVCWLWFAASCTFVLFVVQPCLFVVCVFWLFDARCLLFVACWLLPLDGMMIVDGCLMIVVRC